MKLTTKNKRRATTVKIILMKIGLIDIDSSNFPNLPLMKLSAYHKEKGDNVEWYNMFSDRMDMVYMSKVFSFTKDYEYHVNADIVVKGGSGYAIKLIEGREVYDKSIDNPLSQEIEHIYPDYSIYNIKDTAYGFLTRGCPRGCGFCHVKDKEGLCSRKVADLSEFWNGQKNIVICDQNILACKDSYCLLHQLAESKSLIDFNQGLDARLLTEEKCKLLSKIKIKKVRFAWDKYEDKDIVLKGLEMFAKYSNKPHSHNAIVYTLVNYNTTLEQDLERIYMLRELGYWAYVMIYDKEHCENVYKRLQRWVNNRIIFATCDTFDKYNKIDNTHKSNQLSIWM